ncbi:hypothetical protein Tco_0855744 [Tanacetum coccineum]
MPHNLLRPSSVRVEPIIIVCSRYSGFIATLILSSIVGLIAERVPSDPKTRAHSSGTNLLLFRVMTPPSTGSFSIPCVIDGMAYNFLTPGLPMIPLYEDGDLTTTKFIQAEVE